MGRRDPGSTKDDRAAHQALQTRPAGTVQLVEHPDEGVATVGPDGVLQDTNHRLAALLHTTPRRLVGTRLVDRAADEDRDTVAALLEAARTSSVSADVRLMTTNGGAVPLRVTATRATAVDTHSVSIVATDLTAHHPAEPTSDENAALDGALVDNLPDAAVFMTDRDMRYRRVGGQALGPAGWRPAMLLGRRPRDVASPETAEEVEAHLAVALRGEYTRIPAHQGMFGDRVWRLDFGPLRDPEGDVVGAVTLGRDVTEEVAARQHASETLLNQTQRAAKLGGWSYDVAAGQAEWTDEVYRIHGVSRDDFDVTPERSIAFFAPEDRQRISDAFFRAVHTGEPYDLELRLVTAHGEERWVRTAGQAEWRDGKVVRVFGHLMDVTELHHAQEQFRHERDLNNATLEVAGALIVVVDPEWRILRFNRQSEQLTGYRESEVVGRHYAFLIPPDERVTVADNLEPVTSDLPVRQTNHWVTKDGEIRLISWSNAALVDGAGRRTHIVATGIDITERQQAQEEIERLNADLEDRVRRRTEELESANRSLEAFTYSVSHDLRAPLRALAGFSEALVDEYGDRLDDTGRGYAQRIRSASERMGELIDDLLSLSRVTRTEMTTAPVDLSEVARSVAEDLRLREQGREVRLRVRDGVHVQGDPRLLRVVLENLLDNAWKFTSQAAEPSVEFGTAPDGPDVVHCFVRDNGAGYDPAYSDQLFRPFSRLHSSIQFPGTGVGLAIVRNIVERHGCQTWAESRVGKGTTVHFTLPAVAEGDRADGGGHA